MEGAHCRGRGVAALSYFTYQKEGKKKKEREKKEEEDQLDGVSV